MNNVKTVNPIPEDNSHLDETDAFLWHEIQAKWKAREGDKPRTGDFVIMPDGSTSRFCYDCEYGAQTTTALEASYHISSSGTVSYSGRLDRLQLYEYIKPTPDTRRGRFWMWRHGIAGAGRGIDVWTDCKVFRLEPFPMTEEQALQHPTTRKKIDFWGAGHREVAAYIAQLMAPSWK